MSDRRTPPPPPAPPPDAPPSLPGASPAAGAAPADRSTAAWSGPPNFAARRSARPEPGPERRPLPAFGEPVQLAPPPAEPATARTTAAWSSVDAASARPGRIEVGLLEPELLDSALLDPELLEADLLEPGFFEELPDAFLGGGPSTEPERAQVAPLGGRSLDGPSLDGPSLDGPSLAGPPLDVPRQREPSRPPAAGPTLPPGRQPRPTDAPARTRPPSGRATAGPTSAARPRKRRWPRVLGVLLVILLLLALAALFFLRPLAERMVATKVEALAAARGLEVRWAAVEFGGLRSVRLRDVTVKAPFGEITAAAIAVALEWPDGLRPVPGAVHIERPEGTLRWPPPPGTGSPAAPADAAEAAGSGRPRPPIRVTGGRFVLEHPSGSATVEVHEAEYADGALQARLGLRDARLTRRGAGLVAEGTFGLTARRDADGALTAELGNPGDNRALVVHHPEHGRVELTRLTADGVRVADGRLAAGSLTLRGLRVHPAPHPALEARAHLESLTLSLDAAGQPQVHLRGGETRLALLNDPSAPEEVPEEATGEVPAATPEVAPKPDPKAKPGARAAPAPTTAALKLRRPEAALGPTGRRLVRLAGRALGLDLPPIYLADFQIELDTAARGGDHLGLRLDHAHYAGGALTAAGDVRSGLGTPSGRFAVHASHAPPLGPDRLGESVLAVWLTAAPIDLALLPREPGRRFPTAGGAVDGTLLVHGDLAQEVSVVADLTVREGHLGYPVFEPTTITGIAGTLRLDARLAPGHLRVDRLVAGHQKLWVRAHGQYIDAAPKGRLVAKAVVDPVDCQAALDALPRSLLAPYHRIRATGTWAPQVSLTLPFADPNGLRFEIKDLVGQCVFEELRANLRRVPEIKVGGKMAVRTDVTWLLEPFVFRVTEGVSENALVEVGPGTADYVPLGELPRYVGGAAYLTEEMNFWYGAAISPQLTSKAIATDLAGDRFVYGGSTVTQQLVKNLFLSREKTLLRKFREAIIAGRVVDAVPKERVLELYLNCIEFGPDLFGIGRAARFYFQKHARDLSIREAIFLAMLKPSPRGGASFKRRGTEPEFLWWTRRVHQVIDRLLEAGQITPEQAELSRRGRLRWTPDGTYLPPDPEDPIFEPKVRAPRAPGRGKPARRGGKPPPVAPGAAPDAPSPEDI